MIRYLASKLEKEKKMFVQRTPVVPKMYKERMKKPSSRRKRETKEKGKNRLVSHKVGKPQMLLENEISHLCDNQLRFARINNGGKMNE